MTIGGSIGSASPAVYQGRPEEASQAADGLRGDGRRTDGGSGKLSNEDERSVEKLKEADRKVRAHEAAHLAAGGGLAMGGASFSYATGPDGRRYAVAGEVRIDTGEVPGKPEATIRKMQQVERAALAPADPSSQDRRVAAQAAATEAEARQRLMQQRTAALRRPADPRIAAYGARAAGGLLGKIYL
jgi:hypothetical protein